MRTISCYWFSVESAVQRSCAPEYSFVLHPVPNCERAEVPIEIAVTSKRPSQIPNCSLSRSHILLFYKYSLINAVEVLKRQSEQEMC